MAVTRLIRSLPGITCLDVAGFGLGIPLAAVPVIVLIRVSKLPLGIFVVPLS